MAEMKQRITNLFNDIRHHPWKILVFLGMFGLGVGAQYLLSRLSSEEMMPWILAGGLVSIIYKMFSWVSMARRYFRRRRCKANLIRNMGGRTG
jgi:hypothetical protein